MFREGILNGSLSDFIADHGDCSGELSRIVPYNPRQYFLFLSETINSNHRERTAITNDTLLRLSLVGDALCKIYNNGKFRTFEYTSKYNRFGV